MLKYCFKVFSFDDGKQIAQVVTNVDMMLETLCELNKLGIVKGFILDDKEIEKNED